MLVCKYKYDRCVKYYFFAFSLNLTTSLQLQDEINSQSLDHLCCYVKKFLELVKNQQCKTILNLYCSPAFIDLFQL